MLFDTDNIWKLSVFLSRLFPSKSCVTRFTICTVQLSQTLQNRPLMCNLKKKNYFSWIQKVQKNVLNHVCFWRPTAWLRQFWWEAKARLRTVVPWDGERNSFGCLWKNLVYFKLGFMLATRRVQGGLLVNWTEVITRPQAKARITTGMK